MLPVLAASRLVGFTQARPKRCLLASESGITIRAVSGEPIEPRVRDAAAGRTLLAGCCPLCRMTLLIHGDAMCCPCCGCGWRATDNSIQLLSCSLHPIRACRHWVTICEAADRVLKTTTQPGARVGP